MLWPLAASAALGFLGAALCASCPCSVPYAPCNLRFEDPGHAWISDAPGGGVYVSVPGAEAFRFEYALPDSAAGVPDTRKQAFLLLVSPGNTTRRVPMRPIPLRATVADADGAGGAEPPELPPPPPGSRYRVVLRALVRVPAPLPPGQQLWSVEDLEVATDAHGA
jgi:hypothetical protein